jgi:hypothetical protein
MGELKKSNELIAREEALKDTTPLQLKEEVDKIYKVADGYVRTFVDTQGGGLVDLNKINLTQAEALEKRGILIKKDK